MLFFFFLKVAELNEALEDRLDDEDYEDEREDDEEISDDEAEKMRKPT